MVNKVSSKNYLKDPLFTRTVNAVMHNPAAPVKWKGKIWSVDNKKITNNKKFNPVNLFLHRKYHTIKIHYSKKYRQQFINALDSLKEALKADKEMKKLKKIDELTKKYSKLKDKIAKYETLQVLKQKNILVLKRAIKAEESTFKEYLNIKIKHTNTLGLLKKFKTTKQAYTEQLSVAGNTNGVVAGLTGMIWNAIGMPTKEVLLLKTELEAIQHELNLLHNSYPNLIDLEVSQLDLLIENESKNLCGISNKIKENDFTLLEKLQDEIKSLRRAKDDDDEKIRDLREKKFSLAKSLAVYGYLDSALTVKEEEDEECTLSQETSQTSKTTSVAKQNWNEVLRSLLDTRGNPQFTELLEGLFSHLSDKLNEDIINYVEELADGNISVTLKEPVRFWVSSKHKDQKDGMKGGAIFLLGDNSANRIIFHASPKEVNFFEGITCFCRVPQSLHKFIPPLIKSRIKYLTIFVRALTFETSESVLIKAGIKILKYKREESRHANFKTLLSNWAKDSTVILDRKKTNDAFIEDMIQQDL